jgi:hypothetical protein
MKNPRAAMAHSARAQMGLALGVAGGIWLSANTALAGPVNLKYVPANATSVIHVDVEAGVDSTIGQFIIEHGGELGFEPLEEIAMIEQEIGLSPFEDIFSVTVVKDGDADEVVIVVTNDKVDDALDAIREKFDDEGWGEFGSTRVGGHELMIVEGQDRLMFLSVESSGRRRTVVAGRDAKRVAQVVSLTEGEGESLRRSDSSLASAKSRSGTILFIATLDASEIASDTPASTLLNEASAVVAQFGEDDGEAFAQVSMGVGEDKAELIEKMATGLVALGQLVASNEDVDDEVKDARVALLSAIDFGSSDGNVHVSFRYDVEKFIELLQEAQHEWE